MGNQFNLNEKQKEAVEFNGGDLLIIAGAGTGKTQVITKRILHIINEGWAKPSEILALTFMEKAAQEMQERIDIEADYGYEDHKGAERIMAEVNGLFSGGSLAEEDMDAFVLAVQQAYIDAKKKNSNKKKGDKSN